VKLGHVPRHGACRDLSPHDTYNWWVNTLRAHDIGHIIDLVKVELDNERAMEAA
jgi:hypothetical protein